MTQVDSSVVSPSSESVGSEIEDTSENNNTTSNHTRPTLQTRPTKRTRYEMRKQQKRDLVEEAASLQKQLDGLKYRVLVEQGIEAKTIKNTEAVNVVLDEAIQKHHVELARMQAMITSHVQRCLSLLSPTQTVIRLGRLQCERRSTLMSLKDRKLREAEQFVTARCQGLDLMSSCSKEEQYESPGDTFSVVRFDNVPIRGTNVRAVFDAIFDSIQNTEMIIAEMFGSITIREETNFNDAELSQLRLVTSTPHGAIVESNTVIFSEFKDSPGGGYGVLATDFVDDDELYPYRPDQRVRRDTITLILIRSLQESDSGKQQVVVGTRWSCSKIVPSELDVPKVGLDELHESALSWGDTMKKCISQHLSQQ